MVAFVSENDDLGGCNKELLGGDRGASTVETESEEHKEESHSDEEDPITCSI